MKVEIKAATTEIATYVIDVPDNYECERPFSETAMSLLIRSLEPQHSITNKQIIKICVIDPTVLNTKLRSIDKDNSPGARIINCLLNMGCTTIQDITNKTEHDLLKTSNFGRKSLRELNVWLKKHNLSLKDKRG